MSKFKKVFYLKTLLISISICLLISAASSSASAKNCLRVPIGDYSRFVDRLKEYDEVKSAPEPLRLSDKTLYELKRALPYRIETTTLQNGIIKDTTTSRRDLLSVEIPQSYDKHAKNDAYDFLNDPIMLKSLKFIFGQAIPIHNIKNAKVLILAVERGLNAVLAAENGAKEIVGIDLSDECLGIARQRLKKFESQANIRLIKGNMFDIENLLTNTDRILEKFDIITITNVIFYYPYVDRKYLISEALKLLKDGGRLVISYRTYDEQNYYRHNNCLMYPQHYLLLLNELGIQDVHWDVANVEMESDWGRYLEDRGTIISYNIVITAIKNPESQDAGLRTMLKSEQLIRYAN